LQISDAQLLREADKLLSAPALFVFFNNEISSLMLQEKQKADARKSGDFSDDTGELLSSAFRALMCDLAEPFLEEAVVQGEKTANENSLKYGITTAKKRLEQSKKLEEETEQEATKTETELSIEKDPVHIAKLEHRLEKIKAKKLKASKETREYSEMLKGSESGNEALKKLGAQRAQTEWMAEKDELLSDYAKEKGWMEVDEETFEVKVLPQGVFQALCHLDYFHTEL
jgi:hypothetical protein